ncbi:hypothetical protein [Asticcacaulis benevestitus]|uniref:Uncharacterized protein n=1 Tax=Asticcacaulis benevestitus DSM 16100 = ATCC BAA-896 TaxID=1121022 RepID=V4P7A0_9CAUL|nr:hypothetical protein [Asticcacaulis benevestitus]ESQ82989.1 hypothetical protein ABENE_20485 [Asticcacaulis benevestitus DSM 16100 = ATCC BAA-896]
MTLSKQRNIERFTIDWQGIALSVSYEGDYLNMTSHGYAAQGHIQVEAIEPERAPLPITETGYRSHFIPAEQVERQGGPLAFVTLWIEGAAKSSQWREHLAQVRQEQEATRQLSLF